MPTVNPPIISFAGGELGERILARVDFGTYPNSAEQMLNWRPTVEGPMVSSPGTLFLNGAKDNQPAYILPFRFNIQESRILEFTPNLLRIVSDEGVVEAETSSYIIPNGDFSNGLTSWVQDPGASGSIVDNGDGVTLNGRNNNITRLSQTLSLPSLDRFTVQIVIDRGPMNVRFEAADLLLDPGTHIITFIPTTLTPLLSFEVRGTGSKKLISVTVQDGGAIELTTPYTAEDYQLFRYSQSLDIVYLFCRGHKPVKIERRGAQSWSFVDFETTNGPFNAINTSGTRLTPSGSEGLITVTSTDDLFTPDQVGTLWSIEQSGQFVSDVLQAEGDVTNPIRVTGIGEERNITESALGTFTGAITRQFSFGIDGSYISQDRFLAQFAQRTTAIGRDNEVVFVRYAFEPGDFTDGSVLVSMNYNGGATSGSFRVTRFIDSRTVEAEVLDFIGSTESTSSWRSPLWSGVNGQPASVDVFEGRLWASAGNTVTSSESDSPQGFQIGDEDDRSIQKTLFTGFGGEIRWTKAIDRVLVGTSEAEGVMRSTSFDEPLTPSSTSLKSTATDEGASDVDPVKIGSRIFFVTNGDRFLYQITTEDGVRYNTEFMMRLNRYIANEGIIQMALMKKPYNRLFCVTIDGRLIILTFEPTDNVIAWSQENISGQAVSVTTLSGNEEDRVYVVVKRNIGGVDRFYIERYFEEIPTDDIADTVAVHSGVKQTLENPSNTITGLSHLEGEEVSVLADGIDLGLHTVTGGSVTAPAAYIKYTAGLPYNSDYKSLKLSYGARQGTALTQPKRVSQLGIIVTRTGRTLKFGSDFNNLDELSSYARDIQMDTTQGYMNGEYVVSVDQGYNRDARLVMRSRSPYRSEILALVPTIDINERP